MTDLLMLESVLPAQSCCVGLAPYDAERFVCGVCGRGWHAIPAEAPAECCRRLLAGVPHNGIHHCPECGKGWAIGAHPKGLHGWRSADDPAALAERGAR